MILTAALEESPAPWWAVVLVYSVVSDAAVVPSRLNVSNV